MTEPRSVDRLSIVLLHAEADILIERYIARGRVTGLDSSFWHARFRDLRDERLAHADQYDYTHDTGRTSAEQPAQKLAVLLDR